MNALRVWLIHRLGGVDRSAHDPWATPATSADMATQISLMESISQRFHENYGHFTRDTA